MISVVIPTYNKANYLLLTLTSFLIQSYTDFEVIVIDDGSDDNTKDIVDLFKGKLNIRYFFQENKGRSIARNVGINNSQGSIIVFNDDDRIAHKDFLLQHHSFHIKMDSLVVIGEKRRILSVWMNHILSKRELLSLMKKNRELIRIFTYQEKEVLFKPEDLINNFEETIAKYEIAGNEGNFDELLRLFTNRETKKFHFPWLMGTTANLSCAKQLIQEIGGFDENYKGWGMEDTDLCFRLYFNGASFIYSDQAVNYHQIHPVNHSSKYKEFDRNLEYFMRKYDNIYSRTFYLWSKGLIDMDGANFILDNIDVITSNISYANRKGRIY
jgi:glycosyltransferase involved in cell wall biosynthesis